MITTEMEHHRLAAKQGYNFANCCSLISTSQVAAKCITLFYTSLVSLIINYASLYVTTVVLLLCIRLMSVVVK
jgi:hypothetical protein